MVSIICPHLLSPVDCSRRSDSGVRAKKKASERAGKKRGKTGEEDFLFFARAPLSERLEQANHLGRNTPLSILGYIHR